MLVRRLFGAMLAAGLTLATAHADDFSREEIKQLVLEAIRDNPEIVAEAFDILETRQAEAQAARIAEVLENQRDLLENDPNAPVLGNPDGDVTVIEFFDYNCPYCRRAKPEVRALIADDPNIRLVYREWPILGEGSVFAARAALAARAQGKYEEFHWAMMSMEGRAEESNVLGIAEEIGLDIDQLREDMDAPEVDEHIRLSMDLTQALGFTGTPSFVIGDALVPGFVEVDVLKNFVEKSRETTREKRPEAETR